MKSRERAKKAELNIRVETTNATVQHTRTRKIRKLLTVKDGGTESVTDINLLRTTAFWMHKLVEHLTTVCSAHTVFMCFVFM
jgi:hypothetical protein